MSSIQIRNQDCRQTVIGRRKSVLNEDSQNHNCMKLVHQLNLYQDFYVKFIKLKMGPTCQDTSLDSQTLVWLRETDQENSFWTHRLQPYR